MRHLSCLSDLGPDGLLGVLDAADTFKDQRGSASSPRPLTGRSVALVFEKASTRTRVSLEIAVAELGGHPLVLTAAGSQMGRGEPLEDTARVLSRMVHAITLRTAEDQRLRRLMAFSRVPVINALTDDGHPLQLLADLMTVRRARGTLRGLRFAWLGDGNNMANSWIEAAGLLQAELTLACPQGYLPSQQQIEQALARGGKVRVVQHPREAVQGADVVSTDVFTSMGQEAESAARLEAFQGYQLDEALLGQAAPDAMVLHCLPAHRGEEISTGVLEGPQSHVWDQAEARLHTAKAALCWALELNG